MLAQRAVFVKSRVVERSWANFSRPRMKHRRAFLRWLFPIHCTIRFPALPSIHNDPLFLVSVFVVSARNRTHLAFH
jgi:hypothetical protein